ncbi:MAG: AAA family ATPase [Sulfurimicrobium sp.]|nr:AAA family ATPase [Sulfurimicrobium sp.]
MESDKVELKRTTMLKTLYLKNFTVFADARLEFCSGLNVIVGQNGTGKTQLLKAAYLMNRTWPDLMYKPLALNKNRAEAYFEKRLQGLFQPVKLDNLIRRGKADEAQLTAEVEAFIPTLRITTAAEDQANAAQFAQFPFGSVTESLHWSISLKRTQEVSLLNTNAELTASRIPDSAAVNACVPKSLFIPSKEIVSLYEGLIALLDRYEIKLDATYGDLARSMSGPELSSVPALATGVLGELEDELGGKLVLDGGRLSFVAKDGSQTEGPLMAEGFRKLTTLLLLIRRGVISEKGETLFWDEPEANLNPAYIRWAANALVALAHMGIQVIVATHSLFLLRELEILTMDSRFSSVTRKYFALAGSDEGVVVSAGGDIADIEPLVLLDESLLQSDRYMEANERDGERGWFSVDYALADGSRAGAITR